jgi:hypothetical protein
VRNFEAKLQAAAPAGSGSDAPSGVSSASAGASNNSDAAQTPEALDAGNLLWAILRDKIVGLFKPLMGKTKREPS